MAPGPAGFQNRPLDSPFRNAITISKVGGGEKTNPLLVSKVGTEDLQEALRLSLVRYSLLSESDASAQFSLEVFLTELKQPAVGFTMTVDSVIRYKLIRNRDVQVVYDDIIIASNKATIDDALYGPQRLQLASERSIRGSL
jgi:hypothetical protein